jgi:hypothetical protein
LSLTKDLRQAIFDGLPKAGSEGASNAIDAPKPPLFIDQWDSLKQRVSAIEIEEGRDCFVVVGSYSNKRFLLLITVDPI